MLFHVQVQPVHRHEDLDVYRCTSGHMQILYVCVLNSLDTFFRRKLNNFLCILLAERFKLAPLLAKNLALLRNDLLSPREGTILLFIESHRKKDRPLILLSSCLLFKIINKSLLLHVSINTINTDPFEHDVI